MKGIVASLVLPMLALCCGSASAASPFGFCTDGVSEQAVSASWDRQRLERWNPVPGEIHALDLPNGFRVGVRIDDATAELARRHGIAEGGYAAEMLKISLYDLTGDSPRLLTHTFGATSSTQGYGASGGADRVEELGSPGLLLDFHKPACVQVSYGDDD